MEFFKKTKKNTREGFLTTEINDLSPATLETFPNGVQVVYWSGQVLEVETGFSRANMTASRVKKNKFGFTEFIFTN